MQEILKSYQAYLRNSLGYTTETVVKYIGNLFIIFKELGITSLGDLQAEKINSAWLADLWKIVQDRRGLSDNTVISYQSSLKKYLKFLEDNGHIAPGTAAQIKLARPTQVHLQGLSAEEQVALREYLARNLKTEVERRNAALIMFVWATAARISEALNLRVHKDGLIYTDKSSLRSGSFSIHRGQIYVYIEAAKFKRDRNIPVADEAVAYLNYYLENRKEKSPILFLSHTRNKPHDQLTRSGAYVVFEKVFKKAGIPKPKSLLTHSLRHTAADRWILSGKFTEQQIKAMMGLSSSQTLEVYYHRNRDFIRDFALAENPVNVPGISKEILEIERLIKGRYVRQVQI